MYKTYLVSKASAKAADVARGKTILSPSFLLSHQTLTIHLGLAHDLSGMYSMDQNDLGRAKNNSEGGYKSYLDWKATAKAADLERKYLQEFIIQIFHQSLPVHQSLAQDNSKGSQHSLILQE